MDKRFAIFDMDGTLIDSMPAWKSLGADYLKANGITAPQELRKKIAPMTMLQSGEYFALLGVCKPAKQIARELNDWMERRYRTDIAARGGIEGYLQALSEAHVRCCVATATDAALSKACLERLGILKYFEFVVSCEDIGVTKTSPEIYHIAAERLGAAPAETAVYEDAPYAAKTARDAGYYVVGVFDPACEAPPQRLKAVCDEYITDYFEAAKQLKGGVRHEILKTSARFGQRDMAGLF